MSDKRRPVDSPSDRWSEIEELERRKGRATGSPPSNLASLAYRIVPTQLGPTRRTMRP